MTTTEQARVEQTEDGERSALIIKASPLLVVLLVLLVIAISRKKRGS